MPNTKSQAQNEGKPAISSWDDAIRDVKRKIKEMEYSIRVFKERKKAGEPWPLAGTKRDSVPA
jgi:hypothetical protein